MTAIAKYNIGFNENHFIAGKKYKYRIDPSDIRKFLITTEEGIEQDFWDIEFNTFFTILKN